MKRSVSLAWKAHQQTDPGGGDEREKERRKKTGRGEKDKRGEYSIEKQGGG